MARQPRQLSDSGYLHLIIRGIGKQILFETQEDYLFFLSILKRFSQETSVSVLAYCLMENHVHLLVRDDNRNVPLLMKKIGVSYSAFFNKKYERSGHLFQDRYRSEAIEDDGYLLCVFRYILNNPQKAGLGPASAYAWSSWSPYGDENAFADIRLLRELIGDDAQYEAFLTAENDDDCLEYEPPRHDDEWAKEVLRKQLGAESGTVLQRYARADRDAALKELKRKGLTVRQLERLTGLNRGVIQKA